MINALYDLVEIYISTYENINAVYDLDMVFKALIGYAPLVFFY